MLVAKSFVLSCTGCIFFGLIAQSALAAPTIVNDTVNKLITISGTGYGLTFDYNNQAIISSLTISGLQTLDGLSSQGIYSAANVAGTWYTTQSLANSPLVSVSGNVVTAQLSTPIAAETWTFTASDSNVSVAIARTYNGSGTISQQGTPMLNFAPDAFDAIRWTGDGGVYPVDGPFVNAKLGSWINNSSGSSNMRTSREQIAFTLLNRSKNVALRVTGASNHSGVSRGYATELYRATANGALDLRLSIETSASGLTYATGTSLGYNNDNTTSPNGMTRADGGEIFNSVGVASGQTDSVTLTFAPDIWSNYYTVGTLKGVDSVVLAAAINDYTRFIIQNSLRGASIEQSVLQAEVPPLEMHWVAQLLELFPDTSAINAVKAGLTDISTYLVNSTTGQVTCCRPGTTDTWPGQFYYDQAPGFVIGVSDVFRLSGDTVWLNGIAATTRSALNYMVTNNTNSTTHLVLNMNTGGNNTTFQNDYWETSIGQYNGYTTALLYDALIKWASIEGDVLGNSTNASYYSGIANTIQTNFNLPLSSGGFWSAYTNTFYYGSGNADALYLPVNAAVLKTNLATPSHRNAMIQAIEGQARSGNFDMHPMNTLDLFTSGQAAPTGSSTKVGENGGWYGAPDGDYYAAFPSLGDPQLLNSYISSLLIRYGNDGFLGASTFNRNNWLSAIDAVQWFPTDMMPLWGLYHYQYGFQPADNNLVLAPFISPNEIGSTVNWTWRGNPLTVTYNSQTSFTIAAPVMATNILISYLNQIAGTTYHVQVDGGTIYNNVADSNGTVGSVFNSANAGTHTFACLDCSATPDAGLGSTSLVTSVYTSGSSLRNDVTQQVGAVIHTGSTTLTVHQLGRYFVSGNVHVHTLKLLNSQAGILGTATVDESAGSPDALGFKYGILNKAVVLQPNSTYYLYSLETAGADQWYDYKTQEGTTSAAGFAQAAYGQAPVTLGSSGNSYGPLNIKY